MLIRAILAVVVGVVLWGGLWAGGHAALSGMQPDAFDEQGFTQSAGLLLVFLLGSVPLSVLAGYVAAWIAKRRPMRVVTILAAIQLAIGIAVQAGSWTQMPIWYHIPFLLMVVPAHLLGGWLRTERGATLPAGAVAH